MDDEARIDEALAHLHQLENDAKLEVDLSKMDEYAGSSSELVRAMTAYVLGFPFTEAGEKILMRLANDRAWLVRAEACDSLCGSSSPVVLRMLKSKALKEARAVRLFAVLSLLDVALQIGEDRHSLLLFLKKGLAQERAYNVKQSYYWAFYRLGKKEALQNMMDGMLSKHHEVRSAATSRFHELVDADNYEEILRFTQNILELEPTRMCRSTKQSLIEHCLAFAAAEKGQVARES